MNLNIKINKNQVKFIFAVIILIIAIVMLLNNHSVKEKQAALIKQKLLQEAIAHFDNMVDTRSWNALFGGVYVMPTGGLKPNPHLKDNTLLTKDGVQLIKINPAWMTRQISEISNKKRKYFYRITSLKPLNPENIADEFEREALTYFETHKDQTYYYNFNQNGGRFNFMGSLLVKKTCLKCHKQQGYREGDVRGGIRVSIPSDIFLQEMEVLRSQTSNINVTIIILSLLAITLFSWFVELFYKHQQEIEAINLSLEKKVEERTHSLKIMVLQEKYIKEVLRTVSDVNALLLTSFSLHNVLKDSVDRLAQHHNYRFIWIGLINENLLEVAYKSRDEKKIINELVYSLNGDGKFNNLTALKAISTNRTIIEQFSESSETIDKTRRENDYQIHWAISIPLNTADENSLLGVLNVYIDRSEGFELEEIKVLESLATDIGLILHASQQENTLKKMEHEKIINYEETILAFVDIIEQRDTYTAGHTIRVAEYCKIISIAMGVSPEEVNRLEKAAILHDIGKVATPDAVLLKPGKLSLLEYELIKQHSKTGYNMLSKVEMYKDLAEIIKYHHSRYDGKGYPKTKSPDDIPMLSHILILADAFDAMTTNRIYKPRKDIKEALEDIKVFSGTQFHPEVAKVAIKVLKDIKIEQTVQTPHSDLEQKRFSYFFQDALTELHNESYFQVILSNPDRESNCVNFILLREFSSYNRTEGWAKGNQFLIDVALTITTKYPHSSILRYQGDDFIVLSQTHLIITANDINKLSPFKESNVYVEIKHIDLDNHIYDINHLKASEINNSVLKYI
jgi:two-component system, LuxR family, sensor histidine kinase TtrS